MDRRVAAFQCRQDVAQCGGGQRSHYADGSREGGDVALGSDVEKAFAFQFLLHAQELLEQRAESRAAHGFDIQLEVTTRLVERDEGAHFDLHAFLRLPVEVLRAPTEHDAAHLRAGVLQREVTVSRVVTLEVRNFARDPAQGEAPFQQVAHAPVQFRNADHRGVEQAFFGSGAHGGKGCSTWEVTRHQGVAKGPFSEAFQAARVYTNPHSVRRCQGRRQDSLRSPIIFRKILFI